MNCVIIQPIDQSGIDLLGANGVRTAHAPSTALPDLMPLLADADSVITRNWGFPVAAIELAPRLKVVGVHGTGTDRVARKELDARGIKLVTTPGANAQSVAEHALGLMLCVARGIPQGNRAMESLNFEYRERFRGRELSGLCLGLLGWGSVAKAFAPMARALGMSVSVYSQHANSVELDRCGCTRVPSLEVLLTRSDVVSLHGKPDHTPVLAAPEIALMRTDAILINTARGALVDEHALSAALRQGLLFGAGVDVFAQEPPDAGSPLNGCPGLIMTPHVGGSTDAALRRTSQEVARRVLVELGQRGS